MPDISIHRDDEGHYKITVGGKDHMTVMTIEELTEEIRNIEEIFSLGK